MNLVDYSKQIIKVLDQIKNHSFKIKENESIFIEFIDVPTNVILFCLKFFITKNIHVFHTTKYQEIISKSSQYYSEMYYKELADKEIYMLRSVDYFLGIRAIYNNNDFTSVSNNVKNKVLTHYIKPVHYQFRNSSVKWLYFRLPTPSLAQNAGMSSNDFSDYFFGAMSLNYEQLFHELLPLKTLMNKTKNVKIIAESTNLEFSIENMATHIDYGQVNLPDGEVRTVPIRQSLNGSIKFNTPSTYYGTTYNDIQISFKEGKVISACTSINQTEFDNILSIDEGAKYTGEFAIGVNPNITHPINDILFDEKIFGSIHLALGNASQTSDNGNRSAIHWDLILNLNKEYGGGKIFFDDEVIFDSGRFVHSTLISLNDLKEK